MTAPPQKSDEESVRQWIDFLRFTLADIVARGEWDDFGLFRILNRIAFLSRHHLIFVVGFRKVLNGKHYEADPITSSLDPVFYDLVLDALYNKGNGLTERRLDRSQFEGAKPDKIPLKADKIEDYAIPIWGWETNQFILCYRMKPVPARPGAQPPMSLEAVPTSSALGQFFIEVLKPFDGKSSRSELFPFMVSHHSKLEADVGRELSQLRTASEMERATGDEPRILRGDEITYLGKVLSRVMETVDSEYQRLLKSPLVWPQRAPGTYRPLIPNMMFISKTFDQQFVRYRHYRYDARAMISKTQADLILKALEKADRDDYIPFGTDNSTRKYDDAFWDMTENPAKRHEVLNLLDGPAPAHSRSFAESVLMSGTALIKPGIFKRSAVGWIDVENIEDDEHYDHAMLRICALHYILQFGSPVRPVDAEELSLVSLPFRCAGGIWMCATYVRDNTTRGDNPPVEGLIDQQGFDANMLLYHSIFRDAERRLRRKAKNLFAKMLGETIAEEVRATKGRATRTKRGFCLDETSLIDFKGKSALLTRIIPYEHVFITQASEPTKSNPKLEMKYAIQRNGFFDKLTLHKFLSENDAIPKMLESMIIESAQRTES